MNVYTPLRVKAPVHGLGDHLGDFSAMRFIRLFECGVEGGSMLFKEIPKAFNACRKIRHRRRKRGFSQAMVQEFHRIRVPWTQRQRTLKVRECLVFTIEVVEGVAHTELPAVLTVFRFAHAKKERQRAA